MSHDPLFRMAPGEALLRALREMTDARRLTVEQARAITASYKLVRAGGWAGKGGGHKWRSRST